MIGFFNREGQPITSAQWLALMGRPGYQRVALDEVGEVEVSTVWLGLNHRWADDGPPLIFETMIFGGSQDGAQWRHTSEVEALAAHWLILARMKEEATKGE